MFSSFGKPLLFWIRDYFKWGFETLLGRSRGRRRGQRKKWVVEPSTEGPENWSLVSFLLRGFGGDHFMCPNLTFLICNMISSCWSPSAWGVYIWRLMLEIILASDPLLFFVSALLTLILPKNKWNYLLRSIKSTQVLDDCPERNVFCLVRQKVKIVGCFTCLSTGIHSPKCSLLEG